MSPRFRGGSDDWLDDEDLEHARVHSTRPKNAGTAKSVGLPIEEANALVAEVFPNQCRVKLDADQSHLLCSYRRAHVVSKSKAEVRERTPVAVGDRVYVKQTGLGSGIVEGICVRKNCVSRPAPGHEGDQLQHILAANIDLLVIAASARNPLFSSGLIDRFLVSAELEGIEVLICVTKTDLVEPGSPQPWSVYQDLGYSVVEVCSKEDIGLQKLTEKILNKTVVFCGQSGVGKTSLLRALLGTEIGRVGNVNPQTGKGRHTTTGAVLLGGPSESKWIDTPGVKEFGLFQVSATVLVKCFREFDGIKCQRQGCLHLEEEGCQAKTLPRYPSYRSILNSLIEKS